MAFGIHTSWFLCWVNLAHDVQRQVVANTEMKFRAPYRRELDSHDPAQRNWFISLQLHVQSWDSELYDVCRMNWLVTLTLAKIWWCSIDVKIYIPVASCRVNWNPLWQWLPVGHLIYCHYLVALPFTKKVINFTVACVISSDGRTTRQERKQMTESVMTKQNVNARRTIRRESSSSKQERVGLPSALNTRACYKAFCQVMCFVKS